MKRADRIGVRHLPKCLGRQTLHGPWNFTRVRGATGQCNAAHLRFGEGMPHLGHDVQAVFDMAKRPQIGKMHLSGPMVSVDHA